MSDTCLKFENEIKDAVSRIRFAPDSNNLLISSWDSSLRLYDVDSATLRVEAQAPRQVGLLDCCFQNESVAFTAGPGCCITRYDLDSGHQETIGSHNDLVCCADYSDKTCLLITAGWDRRLMFWDTRSRNTLGVGCLNTPAEVESMSVSGLNLMVAIGSSVEVYDLRDLKKPAYVKELWKGIQIRCVRPIVNCEGFVAGSVDGQVAVDCLSSSDAGYIFWSHPKSKTGRHNVVAVNDIVFNPSVCGAFVTGNDEGYVTAWEAQTKRKLLQLSRCPNSVMSLSFNRGGQLLAVASSRSYRTTNEIEDPPQIFIHDMEDVRAGSSSVRSRKFKRVLGNII